jgi:hypothetical protein
MSKRVSFQTKVVNSGVAFEKKMLEGIEYLALPVVPITEGVHAGSEGPILYLAEELKAHMIANNHRPAVVYHPDEGTATLPVVLNTRKVGLTMNWQWNEEEKKINGQVYVNEASLKAVDSRVLSNINKGVPTEVSTGYTLDVENTAGEWNGEKYVGIARNLHLDHLAILPDQEGACSLKDGAGLLVNSAKPIYPESIQKIMRATIANALETVGTKTVNNQLSFDEVTCQLMSLLAAKFGQPGQYWDGWIRECFPDKVIFRQGYEDRKMYGISYSVTNDTVALVGEAVEVTPVTEYVSVDSAKRTVFAGNTASVSNSGEGSSLMAAFNKEAHVDALIAAGVIPVGEKAEYLAYNEKVLQKIAVPVVANSATTTPPTPEPVKPTPLDWDNFLKQTPPQFQAVINAGMDALATETTGLIAQITGSPGNKFTEADLKAMPLPVLRNMAALASPANPAAPADPNEQPFYGLFGSRPVVNRAAANEKLPEQTLDAPTL